MAASSPASRAASDIARIFVSNLGVNLSAFAVLMLASRFLGVTEFAELSNVIAIVVVGASCLDAGLNITATKFHASGHGDSVLLAMVSIKTVLLLAALPLAALAWLDIIPPFWAVGAIAATATNLWGGLRARDQARMDYARLWASSVKLALARLALGLPALATGSWLVVAAALWIAPVLLLAGKPALTPWRHVAGAVRAMAGYSVQVYISGLAFAALAYAPQIFINARLAHSDVATFGLALIVLGPITLIAASLRAYALPRIANPLARNLRPNKSVMAAGLAMVATGLGLTSFLISWFYATSYPQIGQVYAISATSFTATVLLGFYNLRIHRFNLPHLELIANIGRLLALFALLYAFGVSLLSIAWISGVVLVAGELWLATVVRRAAP